MSIRICLLALCLLAGTSFGRRHKLEKVQDTVPYFELSDEGTCDNTPTSDDDFSIGLRDICQGKSEGEVLCVCRPKKPCHQEDHDDDDSEEEGSHRENMIKMFSNPTELEYEKKCNVCRTGPQGQMRWRKCEEADGCPKDGQFERCDRRRPGKNNKKNNKKNIKKNVKKNNKNIIKKNNKKNGGRQDKLEMIKDTVPHFDTNEEGTCNIIPTSDDEFNIGLRDICEDKSEGEVVCVCRPKKPCHQDDHDNEGSRRRKNIMEMFSNPTELEYEKKCNVCRTGQQGQMRWRKCEEADGCPEDAKPERCHNKRPGKKNNKNKNGGRNNRHRNGDRNSSSRRNNRPNQLRSGSA